MKTSQFKTSQFLGAVFLSILGVSGGAQAETAQSVQRAGQVDRVASQAEGRDPMRDTKLNIGVMPVADKSA